MPKLEWTDADEIGHQLHQAHPEVDPMSARFAALRQMVLALPGFAAGPGACSESVLEAIQMAWLECRREER